MASIFALTKLFDDVRAQFATDGTAALNAFGWRTPTQKVATNGDKLTSDRVLWIPGDETGDMGETVGAQFPGRNPRPLDTLAELCTVEITACDELNPEDERAQYERTRALFDAWYRAVYLAARGNYKIQSIGWVVDKRERRTGATIRVVLAINAMIPDEPLTAAPADTQALVATSLFDVTETSTVTAGD